MIDYDYDYEYEYDYDYETFPIQKSSSHSSLTDSRSYLNFGKMIDYDYENEYEYEHEDRNKSGR